jgi:hypothetical protein
VLKSFCIPDYGHIMTTYTGSPAVAGMVDRVDSWSACASCKDLHNDLQSLITKISSSAVHVVLLVQSAEG